MVADHVKATIQNVHDKMVPGLYWVHITDAQGKVIGKVPVEAEFFTARTHAGHVLRGYAVHLADFQLRCNLINSEGQIVGQAKVTKDGATQRGANITTFVPTPEQKAAWAERPKINKVDWI